MQGQRFVMCPVRRDIKRRVFLVKVPDVGIVEVRDDDLLDAAAPEAGFEDAARWDVEGFAEIRRAFQEQTAQLRATAEGLQRKFAPISAGYQEPDRHQAPTVRDMPAVRVCECGAAATRSSLHSTWCPAHG